MTTTPDLGIPELAQSQANPDITHNEALVLIQALLNGALSIGDTAPPGSPAEGDIYVLGASPTGAWAGRGNCIAIYWGGAWRFVPGNDDNGTPIVMGARHEGLTVYVRDVASSYTWGGSPLAWIVTAQADAALDARFVNVTGDTMTGNLIIAAGSKFGLGVTPTEVVDVQATGAGNAVRFQFSGEDTVAFRLRRFGTSGGLTNTMQRARGTIAAPTAVLNLDLLGAVFIAGHGGTTFRNAFAYQVFAEAATPSETDMESSVQWLLAPPASVVLTEFARFRYSAGLSMYGANVVIDANRLFVPRNYTVATLPVAPASGAKAHVTDALGPVFGAAVVGGGAVDVPVYYDAGAAAWFVG